jgi:hypothetical protein
MWYHRPSTAKCTDGCSTRWRRHSARSFFKMKMRCGVEVEIVLDCLQQHLDTLLHLQIVERKATVQPPVDAA